MSRKNKAQFEGRLQITGSVAEIERALAAMQKYKGVAIDGYDEVDWEFKPFPPPGMIDDLRISAVLNKDRFVKKKLSELNKRLPKSKQVVLKYRPGHLINGGRKYYHLHVGDKIVELNDALFNEMVLEATVALGRLDKAGRI